MSWDAIGAIAELAGAVAVIISIIYLAAQVKQTRLHLESQAEDNIQSRAFEAYSPVYEGSNAQIFRRGLETPAELSADEAFVFKLLMDRQRGAFATIVRHMHTRSVAPELSRHFVANYRYLFLETNGGKAWFENARSSMSKLELRALEEKV